MIDIPTLRFRPNKSPARVMFGFPWIYSDDVILDRRTKKNCSWDICEDTN